MQAVEMVPAVQSHQDPDAPEHVVDDDGVSLVRSFQVLGPTRHRRDKVLGLLLPPPSSGGWFKKLRLFSPWRIFQHAVDEREEVSLSVSSPVDSHRRFGIGFLGSINWSSVSAGFREWIEHPRNAALLVWLICVSVSTAMQGLLLLGLLDEAFPTKASRNHWIEINNQVLNALFTLMSLYQHPSLFHHLVLLCRWRPEDVTALRKIYCKDGAYRPHEWVHMSVVLLLLHITCFAQYISCGLYWGYTSEARPEFAEIFFFGLGLAAPVMAGAYAVYSPLGRECDAELDEESQGGGPNHERSSAKPSSRLHRLRSLVSNPKWAGGLFDCRDDITVGFLSCFCTFCVFGWNMERLGFGNMYVHITTFLLLCFAPFWIFNISALNIHDDVIGDMVGIAGIVLCVFGLLYGGFWRIQMRKRFRLPGNELCCGSKSLTDYLQWLFCWSCSLAQEVRTGNSYEVEDDTLYRKRLEEEEEEDTHPFLHPLPRESGFNSLGKLQYDTSLLLISYPAKSPASTAAADESKSQEDEPRDAKEAAYLVLDFALESERALPDVANGSRGGGGGGGLARLESPEVVVRQLYEAINARDVAKLHRLLKPDLEWRFHGPPKHQHLKRLLTGEEETIAFKFEPQEVAAFGSTVVAEGCGLGALWVHAWTVEPEGVITQVREYFNTSLTVARVGADSPASSSSEEDSDRSTTHCLPVWHSRLHRRAQKSLPGLVLAI
ncbi:hypothetical protein GW17_00010496 [Ensete ventricosum]|nr:hypothetical protein GW17_00010496 [Ensete ventricosum]